MIVAGLAKSSLIDYPDHIACVLFTPGCNFDCFYCHNRTLIDGSHTELNQDDIKSFLRKRVGQLDGVVITGGEPTLQTDLPDFLSELKQLGYKVKLDTNGSSPEIVKTILIAELADYFAVDYKAPSDRYQEICGSGADAVKVLQTIRFLSDTRAAFEVRTTVIPQLDENDLVKMAQELPRLPRYALNRYRKPEVFLPCDTERIEAPPYTAGQIKAFTDKLRKWQPNVIS